MTHKFKFKIGRILVAKFGHHIDPDEILMMLALKHSNENQDKQENMRLLFDINDSNKNGTIEKKEFHRMVKIYRILSGKPANDDDSEKIDNLFRSIDRNNSGFISHQEFNDYISSNPHAFDIVLSPLPHQNQ